MGTVLEFRKKPVKPELTVDKRSGKIGPADYSNEQNGRMDRIKESLKRIETKLADLKRFGHIREIKDERETTSSP